MEVASAVDCPRAAVRFLPRTLVADTQQRSLRHGVPFTLSPGATYRKNKLCSREYHAESITQLLTVAMKPLSTAGVAATQHAAVSVVVLAR